MFNLIKKRQQNYRECFGTEAGKAVLKDLFKAFKVNQASVTGDAIKDSWNTGRKSAYLYIINIMGQDLEKLLQDEGEL